MYKLEPMGRAAEGALSISPYRITTEVTENREFVKAILAQTKMNPVLFHATAWVSIQLITTAIQELKGEVDEPERVVTALRSAGDGLATPMGRIKFDQYNQIVPPLYIRQARIVEGKLRNVGIEELAPVPQEAVWGWWRRK